MSSPLDGDFLFSEGEVIVGCDVIDDPLKAFYGDVLGYVSFIQNFYQQSSVRLRAHEQLQKGDSNRGLVELFPYFELALLDNVEELAGLLK